MTTEELLQAGIAAAKAGDIATASTLLIQVVQTNPNSEWGWLWLGLCRTASEQRAYCFRRVLALNPQNAEARHQMELLHGPADHSAGIKPLNSPGTPARDLTHPVVEPPKEKVAVNQTTSIPQPAKKVVRRNSRKKIDNILVWTGAGFILCACIAAAGILMVGRTLSLRNELPLVNPGPASVLITATPSYTPVFESTPCKFRTPEQARVDCGFVIVPEDRGGDLTDTIRLAVAVYHSTSSTPKPDPILYLQGGPGDEALRWSASAYAAVIVPLSAERDFIVFDPRGVGHSEPELNCDEFGRTYLQDLQGKVPGDKRFSYYQGALLSCKNNLAQQGAKLSAYTSVDMAADARDVILALGYSQANLYGISYGTRVGQFVMRNHPEVVRSAILDSVVPVEVQLLNEYKGEDSSALQVLFTDCKADPACSSAYPDLEAVYKEVFNRLNTQPIHVTYALADGRNLEQWIDGYSFRNAVLWTLRVSQTIPLAPELIHSVRDSDDSTLTISLEYPILAFDSISLGAYISVNCHDQVFAMPFQDLDTTIFEMCKFWDTRPAAPGENDPVSSEIPTLILSGRYDPITPPSYARQLAGHLAHSTLAEIPDQGHAPSATGVSDCPIKIISAFVQDPNIAPDLACIHEIPPVKFIVP